MGKQSLPQATYPRNKVSVGAQSLTYGLAAVITVMVAAQLMTYDRFVPILENYQFGTTAATKSYAAMLVISAVIALPFLLRMSLSLLMRVMSVGFLLIYSALWLFLGLWDSFSQPPTIGSGLLGGIGRDFIGSDITIYVAFILFSWSVIAAWVLHRDFKR
jgi:hypothetical protein